MHPYATLPTRRAIFELDRLVRSVYTLRYRRDPHLQRNVHRSQNRIESYHQLRSAIAQYETSSHEKALALITAMSPVAWRHVHMNGHYTSAAAGRPSIWTRSSRG